MILDIGYGATPKGAPASSIYLNYHKSSNFGDALNPYFIKLLTNKTNIIHYEKLHNKRVRARISRLFNLNFKPRENFMVIGSILELADSNTIVWGSGFISEKSYLKVKPKKILAVRGPLTRKKVINQGIECPEIFGDPCLLLPRYYHPNVKKKYELGLIPHYVDETNPYINNIIDYGVLVINIKCGIENVVKQILSCNRIASSSLHGIIAADAYNIPSVWIRFSNKVIGEGFKFRDYFLSVTREDLFPLEIDANTTFDDIEDKFKEYEIFIDLDKLLDVCPFTKEVVT